tara:strand:+ start:569 stop:826 length:258 start_codon:yes stop_codon:yes gene_type:complete
MTRKKVTVASGKVVKEETLADVIANDPLARNEIRAKAMTANEKKDDQERKARAFQQYIELKIIKGHSKEQATAMAKEIIYNQKPK